MKSFVQYIIKNLVDKPDEVHINELVGNSSLMLEISVAKSDIGKIIGREGKTIKAIRSLLIPIASRNKLHVTVEILEHPVTPDNNTTPKTTKAAFSLEENTSDQPKNSSDNTNLVTK